MKSTVHPEGDGLRLGLVLGGGHGRKSGFEDKRRGVHPDAHGAPDLGRWGRGLLVVVVVLDLVVDDVFVGGEVVGGHLEGDLAPQGARGPGREEGEDGVEGHGREGHVRGLLLGLFLVVADEQHGECGEVPRCSRDLFVLHVAGYGWIHGSQCKRAMYI
jgi:hypothetical protein